MAIPLDLVKSTERFPSDLAFPMVIGRVSRVTCAVLKHRTGYGRSNRVLADLVDDDADVQLHYPSAFLISSGIAVAPSKTIHRHSEIPRAGLQPLSTFIWDMRKNGDTKNTLDELLESSATAGANDEAYDLPEVYICTL